MISFLPLCCHKNPENVLIVGGGDGGVAREVAKHPQVKHIVLVNRKSYFINVDGRNLSQKIFKLLTVILNFKLTPMQSNDKCYQCLSLKGTTTEGMF